VEGELQLKLLLCAGLTMLAGCAHAIEGRAPAVVSSATILDANRGYLCDDRVLSEYHRIGNASGSAGAAPQRPPPSEASASDANPCHAQFTPIANAGANAQQDFRNQVVVARMRVIDANYQDFERGLYSEGVGSGVASGTAAFALTTTSAAIKNSSTQSILSTLAALITGSQAVYNREALFNRTLPALIDSMRADR
jgi:hypothetical protein